MRTKVAQENKYFNPEIVPVNIGTHEINVDEYPKPGTSKEELAKMRTVFKADVRNFNYLLNCI